MSLLQFPTPSKSTDEPFESESLTSSTDEPSVLEGIRHTVRAAHAALETLPDRERDYLQLRFGFDGQPRTEKEASLRFGAPLEEAQVLEADALRKLFKKSA